MGLQSSSRLTKGDRVLSCGVTLLFWAYLATQHFAEGSTQGSYSLVTACDNNSNTHPLPVLLFFLPPSSPCHCSISSESDYNVSVYKTLGGVFSVVTVDAWCSWNATERADSSCPTSGVGANKTLNVSLTDPLNTSSYAIFIVNGSSSSVSITCNSSTPKVPANSSETENTSDPTATITPHTGTNSRETASSNAVGPKLFANGLKADEEGGKSWGIFMAGVALMAVSFVIVAVIGIVCVVNKYKQRRKSSDDQTEKGPASSSPKKRQRGKASSNGASTSGGAALGRSIDSLINDQHNYEEVSEDGISGDLPFAVTPHHRNQLDRKSSKKTSTRSQRNTNDYSHIKSGQPRPPPPKNAATPPIPSSTRPSTSGVHHGSDEDDYNELDLACSARQNSCKAPPKASTLSRTLPDVDDVEDDYNKLDLAHSTRQNSCKAATATARTPATTFYVGDEDGDYMEVGDDIYEAVDNEVEETPLCVRKATTGAAKSATEEAEYTDCASDGRLNPALDIKGPGTAPPLLSSPNPASSSSPQKRPAPRNRNPAGLALPSLPTSPPPCKGLRRNRSRSVEHLNEKLEAVKAKRKAQGHKLTQSVDLSASSGDLCRQRDLFLDNFRSQGDGAEMTEAPGESSDYAEVSGSNEGIALTDSTRNRPAASSTENPSSSPPTEATPRKPGEEWGQVVLRKKSRNSQKKSMLEQAEGRLSMVDHLKVLNTGLLELESAVRHSMEIHEDELVMIDNVLYGTLPRNRSLPTTEL
ncbi:hypothetical protein V1264_016336 [Littorina saxatilis]